MTNLDEEQFTFSWLALKLLGKGLYSNPWSALSELVANGLDAGAANVHVYLDLRTRGSATIEVFDDGSGMDREDLSTYVRVGYNKRKDLVPGSRRPDKPMGRKGIGKLAALYLSQNFYLRTRRGDSDTVWNLDAREGQINDDEHPSLRAVPTLPNSENIELWDTYSSGTFLALQDVDLRGYGTQSVEALSARLANQFLLSEAKGRPKVLLFVRTTENSNHPVKFVRTRKEVAFKNFAFVAKNFSADTPVPQELSKPARSVRIPAPGLPDDQLVFEPEIRNFRPAPSAKDIELKALEDHVDFDQQTFDGHPFSLTGWLALHATIDSASAKENDSRFRKNRYYNPAQIRVYVRGKLASERLLGQLGITGTYVNYIEGEISFDLLDQDDLDDIATSNRQDFDETDRRVLLLRALVRPVVRGLIQQRNALAADITARVKKEKARVETASKSAFVAQLGRDLAGYEEVPQHVRDEIQSVVSNKVKGDVVAKSEFRVFMSHARADKKFADFVYELLLARGALPTEIYYTSRTGGDTDQYGDPRALGVVIRENIVSANTLIFYLTSRYFIDSQFCLFEGGAGWATRAVGGYLKLNLEYESIPPFLSNSTTEMTLLAKDRSIQLTPEIYGYLVDRVLNPMIEHLNHGREIFERDLIMPFTALVVHSQVDLARAGKAQSDYFDETIVEHWRVHIDDGLDMYVGDYFR